MIVNPKFLLQISLKIILFSLLSDSSMILTRCKSMGECAWILLPNICEYYVPIDKRWTVYKLSVAKSTMEGFQWNWQGMINDNFQHNNNHCVWQACRSNYWTFESWCYYGRAGQDWLDWSYLCRIIPKTNRNGYNFGCVLRHTAWYENWEFFYMFLAKSSCLQYII